MAYVGHRAKNIIMTNDGQMYFQHPDYHTCRACELEQIIERVDKLHVPKPCWCCEDVLCANCDEAYPCSTKRALDGEQG